MSQLSGMLSSYTRALSSGVMTLTRDPRTPIADGHYHDRVLFVIKNVAKSMISYFNRSDP